MKKILLITAFLTFGLCSYAQSNRNDNFFNTFEDVGNGLDKPINENPIMPGGHGNGGDINLPLGTGLLILTALGGGYAITRRKQ
ncbi:MAG: hypothetical protein J6W12_03300 [Bacteroidales bacterium]|nr:hypothetical protein [Bacteroidales bacterium]